MEDEEKKLDSRDMSDLYRAFEQADYILMKKYQYALSRYQVCDLPEALARKEELEGFQLFQIAQIVYDKDENTLDKLTTVYHSLMPYEDSAVLMLLIGDKSGVELYCGVACRGKATTAVRGVRYKTLEDVMQSNFPGIKVSQVMVSDDKKHQNSDVLDKVFANVNAVSAVSGIAAPRREKAGENEAFVQGIEKLVDTMRGKRYSALFIADCVPVSEVEKSCADYEDIYSQLSPFLQSQQSVGKSAGVTDTDSLVEGVTDTINESTSSSVTHGTSVGSSRSNSVGGSVNVGIHIPQIPIPKVPIHAGVSASLQHTAGTNESESHSEADSATSGTAQSLTKQNSVAKALSSTDTENLQITFQNRSVKTLLERIDEQIKRLRACEDFGIYDFGAYFMAPDPPTAVEAAATYQALMRGENSSTEASAINTWYGDAAQQALRFLRKMAHPQIAVPDLSKAGQVITIEDGKTSTVYGWLPMTPTSLVSGRELAIHMGLPKRSIPGVAVIPCAEFGREVVTYHAAQADNAAVKLGSVVHMRRVEEASSVQLDCDSLTAHTFITGSTGAGKSNAVYVLLDKLTKESQTRFLVVEPAKGEYKDAFGGREDVHVYGTNPYLTPLLKINPFSFPNGKSPQERIHVLEHMDRLVEIFNVCWSMYAAMPAVLKEAIERAYTAAGWDMRTSVNRTGTDVFPTFQDVLYEIQNVIDSSDYSGDTKGDYKGALITRLRSLTNGLNGQIFSAEELSGEQLFDENVIVDLSRAGSTETKALIMGLMVMKLQEHRMTHSQGSNSALRHVTVLEEAHNLLKRTSTEQSSEGANLLGKSVEMLTNAIAEMRTYGEGFIIADQAPGLLDPAVIRNTNTKIILRLPEQSDRELVGRAAGLNDAQIEELSRLDRGVAAVYQNGWLEAVLCQIERFSGEVVPYQYVMPVGNILSSPELVLKRILGLMPYCELSKADLRRHKAWVQRLRIGPYEKALLLDVLEGRELPDTQRGKLIYDLFQGKKLMEHLQTGNADDAVKQKLNFHISEAYQICDTELVEQIRSVLIEELCRYPIGPLLRSGLRGAIK